MIRMLKDTVALVTEEGFPTRDFRAWLQHLLAAQVAERLIPTPVQTTDFTARPWDLVRMNPTAGALTLTLPAGARSGDQVGYKNTSGSVNTVTIEAPDGDTVEGAAWVTNSTANGSEWFIYDAATNSWSAMR